MQNELHDPILFAKYFIRISFLIFFIFIKKLLEIIFLSVFFSLHKISYMFIKVSEIIL